MIFHSSKKADLQWAWLGQVGYDEACQLQQELQQEIRRGQSPETLLFLEHPSVFTLGRSAREEDILIDSETLNREGVWVRRSDRGGKVTYHGPGQLVGYLLVDLKRRRWSVPHFVGQVTATLQQWCRCQGVETECRSDRPGLWQGPAKLASVGFHVSRGFSRHGFAINLNTDLKFFEWIVPCGLSTPVQSLQAITQKRFDLAECASGLASQFSSVLSVEASAPSSS